MPHSCYATITPLHNEWSAGDCWQAGILMILITLVTKYLHIHILTIPVDQVDNNWDQIEDGDYKVYEIEYTPQVRSFMNKYSHCNHLWKNLKTKVILM